MGDALVRLCENYVHKGSRIFIRGKFQTRKWQGQDGQDRYATEIVVGPFKGEITLLDSPNSGDREAPSRERQPAKPARSFAEDLDDDVPF
jgi:single-strand DNA-binding protein